MVIPAGVQSVDVMLVAFGNNGPENFRSYTATVTLTLDNDIPWAPLDPGNFVVGDSSNATVQISDNPTLEGTPYVVAYATSPAVYGGAYGPGYYISEWEDSYIGVVASGWPSTNTVNASFSGMATANDYWPGPGSLTVTLFTINPYSGYGAPAGSTFIAPVIGVDEDSEKTIQFTIGSGDGYVPGLWDAMSLTFAANTPSPTTVSVSPIDPDASQEGPSSGAFRISRTGDTSEPLTVTYDVSGSATPGVDYAPLAGSGGTGSVTIPAGANNVMLTVDPTGSGDPDGIYETVDLTLTPGANDGTANPTYIVGDNEEAEVTISPAQASPVQLLKMQFADAGTTQTHWDMWADDGSTQYLDSKWQWYDTNGNGKIDLAQGDHAWPVAYVRNTTMAVTAVFQLTGSMFTDAQTALQNGKLAVQGYGSDYTFLAKQSQISLNANSNQLTVRAVAADNSLPNEIAAYENLMLTWQLSLDGGTNWTAAGRSENPVYVLLSKPNLGNTNGTKTLYYTVVELGCQLGKSLTSAARCPTD